MPTDAHDRQKLTREQIRRAARRELLRRKRADRDRDQQELAKHGFVEASERANARALAAGTRLRDAEPPERFRVGRQQTIAEKTEAQRLAGLNSGPRVLRNLRRQLEEAPAAVGPALVNVAKSVGGDVADPEQWDPRNVGKSRTYRRVLKPSAQDLRYLTTGGPVVLRTDERGRTVYRAKGGGETTDRAKAKTGILAKATERPLDYGLLAQALATGGASAALRGTMAGAKVGLVPKRAGAAAARALMPGTKTLFTDTGVPVTRSTSRNPVVRAEGRALRAAGGALTGGRTGIVGHQVPVVGEHARAVRLLAKQKRRQERADVQRGLAPFERAQRGLSGPEKIAVVLRAKGLRPSEFTPFVKAQEAEARAKLDKTDGRDTVTRRKLRGEILDHKRMQKFVGKVDDDLFDRVDKDPKLRAALDEADELMRKGGDVLEHVELLDATARAARPYLNVRVMRGARYVKPTPGRLGKSPALDRESARLAQLEKRHARAVGKAEAYERSTRPMRKAEAQARLAELDARWDKFVDGVAARIRPDAKISQKHSAYRNRVKSPDRRMDTISEMVERDAIVKAQAFIDSNRDHPSVQKVIAEQEEAARLRKALERDPFDETAAKGPAQYGRVERGRRTYRPSVERLGGAISVQKDKIQTLEKQATGRVRDTGFVGGPDIDTLAAEFERLVYHPDAGGKLRTGQRPLSRSGANKLREPGEAKRNKAVRFLASRWLPTPDAWRDSYVRAVAYMHAHQRGELATRLAKELNEDGSTNKGWYFVNPEGVKISRAAKERSELADAMENFDGDLEGFVDSNIATQNPQVAAQWQAQGVKVGQLSPADYRQLFGEFRDASRLVKYMIDKPTDFWRTLTLNYRPAWIVNNFVGQTLLYALNHSGPGGAKAYAEAIRDEARRRERYFPEELRYGFVKAEGNVSGPIRVEREMRDRISRFNAALSDNVPRRAAWYKVGRDNLALLNRIEGTNKKFDEFLSELKAAAEDPVKGDTKLRDLHDSLVQEVLDELIDFGNLSHAERAVIRRALPFYSWIKGITLATGRLAVQHPAKAELLNLLAQQAQRDGEEDFGEGAALLENFAPLGDTAGKVGGEVTGLSTAGLNPFQTVSDVNRYLRGALSNPDYAGDNPANALNPVIQLGGGLYSRRDAFTGKPLEAPGGIAGIAAVEAAKAFPQYRLFQDPLVPERAHNKLGEPRLTVPGVTYRPEVFGHEVPIPQSVARYVGVPLVRKNVDAAQRIAEDAQRRALSPRERVETGAKAAVEQLREQAPKLLSNPQFGAPKIAEAIDLRARRELAYQAEAERRGLAVNALPSRVKLEIQLRLAVEAGTYPRELAERKLQRLRSGERFDERWVKFARGFWRSYGEGDALALWKGKLTKAGVEYAGAG